jgi:Carboxypeptidase regulatory-like domain/TonB-dependent Receptor Plug Domain/TonB dependent receptor
LIRTRSTNSQCVILVGALLAASPVAQSFSAVASAQTGSPNLAAQEKTTAAASDKVPSPKLLGVVVDASGAVIGGATVQVRSANGLVLRTTSDSSGSFIISGLPAGDYRILVSKPDFETKEVPVAMETFAAPAPLRITLAVSVVNTTIRVDGRGNDLIGIADSSTEGTVGATEIQDRPLLRSGEVLETVPGVIITQHAGGGKANQYFLRGFNLDHGTDFAIFIDDMPLNLPSHAHGEGYSDMNTVIPELVKRVNFEKGPYYANVGDFGAAGSAHLEFFKTLPENFFRVEGGQDGYGRMVFGVSRNFAAGNLLYGGEAYHDNGPWTHEDNYYKYNGLATYSQGRDVNGFSITARAYRGTWHSSDQIPVDAVALVGYFGALDPTDGGHSQRFSLQGEWHRQGAESWTKITAYGFYYDLNLFSDFTYFLDDLAKGDQFEQQDRRWVAGLDAHHTIFSEWLGRRVENTIGLQVRIDWIHNGLFRTENRERTDKNDGNACNEEPIDECAANPDLVAVLPAATDLNKFTDTLVGVYAENKIRWAAKFRSDLAVRGDDAKYVVASLTPSYAANELPSSPVVNFAALNSGTATKFLPQPKLSVIFGPWSNTEFYAQGGFSYHSNDARGATQREEPISADNPFPTPSTRIPPLVQLKGGEFGVRTTAAGHLQSTLSLWYLRSNSELQQDGDTGGTVASEQSSNRYGTEWANYYTPTDHWALDLDMADSRAQFTQIDPADAAYSNRGGGQYPVQGPGGKLVPEAVKVVISSGITLHDYKRFTATTRLRYFGPRDLTSDGLNRSAATLLINAGGGYQIGERWRIFADFLNVLDRRNDDITYAYVSRVTPTGPAAFTNVFHPAEPFEMRVWLQRSF